jgi:hypothetical protein
VPTNVQFFISRYRWIDHDWITLKSVNDPQTELPFRIELPSSLDSYVLLAPEDELLPSSTYHLTIQTDYPIEFKTGEGPDLEPPTFQSVLFLGASLEGSCGPHLASEVFMGGADDNGTPVDQLLTRLDVTDQEDGSSDLTLFVRASSPLLGDMLDDDASCLFSFPGAKRGKTYHTTVTALDMAGNASIPSEKTTFSLNYNEVVSPGCLVKCATDGKNKPSGLVGHILVSLAVLAMLRYNKKRIKK